MIGVNVMAPLNISQIVAAKMIENKIQGSIVNISSEVIRLSNIGVFTIILYNIQDDAKIKWVNLWNPILKNFIHFKVAKKPQLRNVGYSLSKASMEMLTKVMAYELGKHKIRVNCVAPGAVLTPLLASGCDQMFACAKGEGIGILKDTLLRRRRMPTGEVFVGIDDIVNTTLFLLTDLAPMMIGETILVDGGQHLTWAVTHNLFIWLF